MTASRELAEEPSGGRLSSMMTQEREVKPGQNSNPAFRGSESLCDRVSQVGQTRLFGGGMQTQWESVRPLYSTEVSCQHESSQVKRVDGGCFMLTITLGPGEQNKT